MRSSRDHDAERLFDVGAIDTLEPAICISGQILQGIKKPTIARRSATQCTPQHPLGATMVSAEGACAAYYAYGRHLTERCVRLRRGMTRVCRRSKSAEKKSAILPRVRVVPAADFRPPADRAGPWQWRQAVGRVDRKGLSAAVSRIRCSERAGRPAVLSRRRAAGVHDGLFVVTPIFFPGGDIGSLAVNGTVNDLAMGGAKPLLSFGGIHSGRGPADGGSRARCRFHAAAAPGRRATCRRRYQGGESRQGRQDIHHHDRHRQVSARRAC